MKKLLYFAHFQSSRLLKKEKLKLTLTNFHRFYASHACFVYKNTPKPRAVVLLSSARRTARLVGQTHSQKILLTYRAHFHNLALRPRQSRSIRSSECLHFSSETGQEEKWILQKELERGLK